MRQTRPPYQAEFRHRIVTLARSGQSARNLAAEFGCTERSIRSWKRRAELDEGLRPGGLNSQERKELARLRRENQQLREERDILKKACAWSAREAAQAYKRLTDS